MTPAELTVVAALGASFLTVLGSLGVVTLQERLRGKAGDRDALAAAVIEMLSRSMAVATRAQAMGETMKLRSGLGEGVDVATRLRKPADPLELHDWMAQDLAPLNAAWSVIWARGDQEMVRLGNDLLSKCSDLVGVSTAMQPADSPRARLRRWAIGQRWTPEMQADLQSALKEMAHARKRLAEHARGKLGQPHVNLFGHGDDDDGSTIQVPGSPQPDALQPPGQGDA